MIGKVVHHWDDVLWRSPCYPILVCKDRDDTYEYYHKAADKNDAHSMNPNFGWAQINRGLRPVYIVHVKLKARL